jgi:hypothetical protein
MIGPADAGYRQRVGVLVHNLLFIGPAISLEPELWGVLHDGDGRVYG